MNENLHYLSTPKYLRLYLIRGWTVIDIIYNIYNVISSTVTSVTIKIFLLFIFRQTTRLLRVECEDGALVAPDQEGGRQAPAEAVQPSHVQARARHPAPRQRQRHHHQRRPR